MKAAMRPVDNTRDMSVLDRIEMDIVDMALQIGIIANGVLPIATLPDALLSLARLACGSRQGTRPREKPLLIKLQREEKSASRSGSAQTA